MKGGFCMGCETETPAHNHGADVKPSGTPADVGIETKAPEASKSNSVDADKDSILFRCLTCKRVCHYEHLPIPADYDDGASTVEIAQQYQSNWLCADCVSLTYHVDKILAWRPYPATAVEPPLLEGEIANWKNRLPREYLVKWIDRSYRRTTWVPHMWLVSTHAGKLRPFLAEGGKVDLLEVAVTDKRMDLDEPGGLFGDSRDASVKETPPPALPTVAIPDAEARIPLPWKSIDRILDLVLWRRKRPQAGPSRGKGKGKAIVIESDEEDLAENEDYNEIFTSGETPAEDLTETLDEWQRRTRRQLTLDDIDLVVWAFIKWNDLGYEDGRPYFYCF